MKRPSNTTIFALVSLVLVLAVIGLINALSNAKAEKDTAEANLRASQDTLRTYKDSTTQTIARYAFQEEVNTDSIRKLNTSLSQALRANNAKARLITQLTVAIDSIQVTSIALVDTVSASGVRVAIDTLKTPPILGNIEVRISQQVQFIKDLSVAPIPLDYVLSCDDQHNAQVNIQGPTWASLNMGMSTVDPHICRRPGVSFLSFKPTLGGASMGAVLAAIGYLLGKAF